MLGSGGADPVERDRRDDDAARDDLLHPVRETFLSATELDDGHDRGAKVIARALRDAGMEVIYTGLRQTPEMIAAAALQEDVDAVGISILSGAHKTLCPRIVDLLRENGMDDTLVLVGGIVPQEDVIIRSSGKRLIWIQRSIVGSHARGVRNRHPAVKSPPEIDGKHD